MYKTYVWGKRIHERMIILVLTHWPVSGTWCFQLMSEKHQSIHRASRIIEILLSTAKSWEKRGINGTRAAAHKKPQEVPSWLKSGGPHPVSSSTPSLSQSFNTSLLWNPACPFGNSLNFSRILPQEQSHNNWTQLEAIFPAWPSGPAKEMSQLWARVEALSQMASGRYCQNLSSVPGQCGLRLRTVPQGPQRSRPAPAHARIVPWTTSLWSDVLWSWGTCPESSGQWKF